MKIHLPKLAYLPQTVECLEELTSLLDRALGPAKRFRRSRNDTDNDLRLAVAMHALNATEAARSIIVLAAAQRGNVTPYFRTIFDTLVKVRWMRKRPKRATDYLESEPFERYTLATPRVIASSKWPEIVRQCKNAVAQNRALLSLKGAVRKNGRPTFSGIAKALRMPKMDAMAKAIGMDADDYMLDFAFPSLFPHTSITLTKNFAKGLNRDGTVTLSAEDDPTLLLGYVARAVTRVGEILKEVLDLYPDGAILYEAEKTAERVAELVTKLRTSVPEVF